MASFVTSDSLLINIFIKAYVFIFISADLNFSTKVLMFITGINMDNYILIDNELKNIVKKNKEE